mgnify:CR=1 FL=1
MLETKIWSSEQLLDALNRQKALFKKEGSPDWASRKEKLKKLLTLVTKHESEISKAISQDFGNRHEIENQLGDFIVVQAGIKHLLKHGKQWMKPHAVEIDMQYWPSTGYIQPQAIGTVGVIAPWNYPFHLAILPVAVAVAAGNRVMLKPSDLTPRTSTVIEKLIAEYFDKDDIAVVNGDVDVARAFSELPFDHLFFTGSTSVGRLVAQAAAKNLTPVTLELGGKSPVILDDSADLALAAKRIAFTKLFNCGQTCVAPDYVLVPEGKKEQFIDLMVKSIKEMYPEIQDNPDYTSIINDHHYQRVMGLVRDAKDKCDRIIAVGDHESAQLQMNRKPAPTLVIEPRPDASIMQEEIFGPLMPILGYSSIDQAIDYINDGARPLALYFFGKDNNNRKAVLNRTISGGVTINDCMWHVGQENLPFGGVGDSGMGAYHGKTGFDLFTKDKPVFVQSRFSTLKLLFPPYGGLAQSIVKIVKKLL